jgi:hypothetical protein
MLKGSCLCGGIRYEIAGEVGPNHELPLQPVPQGIGRLFCDERFG